MPDFQSVEINASTEFLFRRRWFRHAWVVPKVAGARHILFMRARLRHRHLHHGSGPVLAEK